MNPPAHRGVPGVSTDGGPATGIPLASSQISASANLVLSDDAISRPDRRALPSLYPYWHQADTSSDRLSPACLAPSLALSMADPHKPKVRGFAWLSPAGTAEEATARVGP